MEPTAPTLDPDRQEEPRNFCPRCGAAFQPLQEYCLECGERLPVNRGLAGVLAAGWLRRVPWYPEWLWPSLVLLVLAVAATVLAVLLGARDSTGATTIVATQPGPVGPGSFTQTVPVTTSTGPLPTAPEPTVPEHPKPPKPQGLAVWPAGKSGYTVVLESVPTSSGRAFAVERAKRAGAAGLADVGVLDSANYSSFHPGYYVVFAGIYGSAGQAATGVSTAHAHGYRDAYPKPVTR